MQRNENTILRVIFTILLGCAAVFLYYIILSEIQHAGMMEKIRKEMKENADYLKRAYPEEENLFDEIELSVDEIYEGDLALLCYFQKMDPDFEISDKWLKKYNVSGSGGDLMIADREGHVLASAKKKHPDLTAGIYDPLRETFMTGMMSSLRPDPEKEDETDQEAANGQISLLMENNTGYFARAYDDEHEFILKIQNLVPMAFLAETDAWSGLLENETIGEKGFAFVWADKTNDLLYYPEMSPDSHKADAVGINPDEVRDGEYGWYKINGKRMYLYTSLYQDKGVWIACAVSAEEIEDSRRFTLRVFSLAFALLNAALVYYVILLLRQKRVKVLRDFTGEGKESVHKSRKYKLLILTCVLVVVMFLFQFYLQTLFLMSTWSESASRQTNLIENVVKRQEKTAGIYSELFENVKNAQMGMVAEYLSSHPDQCTSSVLDEISFKIPANEIHLLDGGGNSKVTTSSMAFQEGSTADSTETYSSPAQAVALQDYGETVFDWMKDGRKVIVPMKEDAGAVYRYLFVNYYSHLADQVLKRFSLNGTMRRIQPGNGGFVFCVDEDTKKFVYYPDESLVGRDALEYGLNENQVKDNYCDYITINGTSYYTVTDMIGTNVIYYAISQNNLLGSRLPLCILSILAVAALFLLTGLALYTSRDQIEMIQPEEGRHLINEDKHSPEYRTIRVLQYYLVGAAALIAAYSVFRQNSGSGGVIGYVLDAKWERGVNVFALFSSIIILSRGGLVLFFFSKLVKAVGNILPVRGGTILKMLGSLMTYLAVAYLIYRCMVCFGLNPTALMASAGIVSVVLGIGANSLVGDILAGIFLLMEGNVQVGDVVRIGDFRGYVMEMGIRMTKLFDMDMDDVKIIPNNEVRNVVHMTMRSSIVYSDFQIRYEEKLENIERILREELKNAKHSPLILDGPVYIGVNDLDTSGVVLRTATRCHEPCRRKVEREVNHIVYSIFQRNGISVPYPQVTVHEGDDNPVER